MTNRIDGGEIVVQSSVQAQKAHCSSTNYMLCCTKLGCELLESINFIGGNTNFTFPGKESYFSFPRSIDVIRFWKNGNRFFRWRDISKIFLM